MENLPAELIHEILMRLPAKAVEMCVLASPTCAAVVRRTSFYRDFYRRTLYIQQPRALFATRVDPILPEIRRWMFSSISVLEQERPSLLSTTILPLHDNRNNQFMNYSCGLLCSGFGANPILFNPSNGRHRILPDPDVFSCAKQEGPSFLGFSSETGFKVLAIKNDNCKVFTLETLIWRSVKSILQHKPAKASFCINGIIHYAAYEKPTSMVLISFSVQTERFQINKIPQTPRFGTFFCEKTMNVNGKIGISFSAGCDTHVVWILENAAKDLWSERLIQTPSSIQNDIQQFSPLYLEGFTKLGETVFSQDVGSSKVIYYSDGVNSVRKHIYQGLSSQTLIFWDHMDSTIFL